MQDGTMQGPGICVLPNGSQLGKINIIFIIGITLCVYFRLITTFSEGVWIEGVCEGAARERSATGKVIFSGSYQNGVRHGRGVLHLEVGESKFVHAFKAHIIYI